MHPSTQNQILRRCCRGDLVAQRQLYEHYNETLFGVCLRYARDHHEAQDMLQEAFLTIFRDIHQYRGAGALDGWLYRVTVRCALQFLRRRNPLRFAEELDTLAHNAQTVFPEVDHNAEAILLLVQQLPPGYRTIFNLHGVEEWSYPEIAAELGINESSVRSQYTRACRQLRHMLEQVFRTQP